MPDWGMRNPGFVPTKVKKMIETLVSVSLPLLAPFRLGGYATLHREPRAGAARPAAALGLGRLCALKEYQAKACGFRPLLVLFNLLH